MVADTRQWVRLRSGHWVQIRPLQADDRERLVAAAARLSEESRYRRFHTFLTEMPEPVLDQLLDVDHHDNEALVAVAPGTGEIIGGARFARDHDHPETADLAVVVADDWQQRGLASLLLWRLARRAAEEDVQQFSAVILATNRPTLDLVQRLGPVDLTSEGTTVTARMNVDDWPDLDHSGADVESVLGLLARGEVALITGPTQAWLGLSAELVRTLLIPVAAILHRCPETG
jgi:RimJ/RimL family protein N-acetyltransferase